MGRVQLHPDPNPNFFIGPRLGSRSAGSENFGPKPGPKPRPLGFGESRVWIWVQNNFIFFPENFLKIYYEVQFQPFA